MSRFGSQATRGAAAALLAMAGLGLSACGGSRAASTPTPVLTVVTGLYPLAQAIEQIGQGKVEVIDPVPVGSDPISYELTQAQVEQVRRAGLVVEIGGGFQPSLEAAASAGERVLALNSRMPTEDPYVWLDPILMEGAVASIASAMEEANPDAAGLYREGAQAYGDLVQSTGIDFQSTLSTCPRTTIYTPDDAFSVMAHEYGLRDRVVGSQSHPDPAAVRTSASSVRASGATTVFSEPWLPAGSVQAVAAAAHVRVRSLDTLVGPPAGGWPRQASYIDLMESDLGVLTSALGCSSSGTGLD